MSASYKTYIWLEDGTDADAEILGGGDADMRYVIEAAADSVVQCD